MNEEDLRNVLIKLAKKLNEEEEKLLEEFNSEKISAEEFISRKCEMTEKFRCQYDKIRADFIFSMAIVEAFNKTMEEIKKNNPESDNG